jgi:hypothetical protein
VESVPTRLAKSVKIAKVLFMVVDTARNTEKSWLRTEELSRDSIDEVADCSDEEKKSQSSPSSHDLYILEPNSALGGSCPLVGLWTRTHGPETHCKVLIMYLDGTTPLSILGNAESSIGKCLRCADTHAAIYAFAQIAWLAVPHRSFLVLSSAIIRY